MKFNSKLYSVLQLYKGISLGLNSVCVRQKDRLDISATCPSLLWHRHFPGLFQTIFDFVGNP